MYGLRRTNNVSSLRARKYRAFQKSSSRRHSEDISTDEDLWNSRYLCMNSSLRISYRNTAHRIFNTCQNEYESVTSGALLQPGPSYLRPSELAAQSPDRLQPPTRAVLPSGSCGGSPLWKACLGIVRGTVTAWGDLLQWLLRRELLQLFLLFSSLTIIRISHCKRSPSVEFFSPVKQ